MGTALTRVIAAAVLLAPGAASAGRTQYGWLFGTEVMPERGAEIQTWITEENSKDPDVHEEVWGLQALIGVNDQLELAFPVEFEWRDSDFTNPSTTWRRFGVEARYRLVSGDPVDAPPFAPLVRLAVKRDIAIRNTTIVEANFVISTTTPTGGVMALVDLGILGAISPDDQVFEARPGAGVSFKVVGDLRLGAEVFGHISFKEAADRWIAAGPNLAWSHGRSWVSAAMGIGLYQIHTAPALQWGIMF